MNVLLLRWLAVLMLIVIWPSATVFSQISNPVTRNDAATVLKDASQSSLIEALEECSDRKESGCQIKYDSSGDPGLLFYLSTAVRCENSDKFNVCDEKQRQEYTCCLSVWIEKLKKYLAPPYQLAPSRKSEIQMEIKKLEGRKASIAKIKDCPETNCQKCDDVGCKDICLENNQLMNHWRNLYKKTMQGNQYLECADCLNILEDYYNAQRDLYLSNKLNTKEPYTRKHIEIMWGLLFCLARSTDNPNCLSEAQDILPHAMLPIILPPAELIQMLGEKFKKEGGITKSEAATIVERYQQTIYLLAVLVDILKENEKVPDIPPAELSAVLVGLIKHNSEALKKMPIKDRLAIFNEMFKPIDGTNVEQYYEELHKNKAAFAHFFITVIRKADQKTVKMLESVGFTNDDLRRMLLAVYDQDSDPTKKKFIDMLRTFFDEDRIVFNQLIAEEFLGLGKDQLKTILADKRYEIEIMRFKDRLAEVYPEWDDCDRRECKITHKYLKSFVMPGYPTSCCKADASGWIHTWNYSNFALLGLSLASQMLFIESDYEADAYYSAGVVGSYLFILNGIAGVVHASKYDPAKIKAAQTSSFNIVQGKDRFGLMYQLKF